MKQTHSTEIRPEGPPRTSELISPQEYSLNQISASDINAFHQCPRKFYLHRVLRLGELADKDPKQAANRGSLIHLLLEWGSTDQAEALFVRNQVGEELAAEILSVVEAFQGSQFMQQLLASPKLVREYAFYLQLSSAGQTSHYLKGFIDALVWQDDGSLLIVDYKTGRGKADMAGYQSQADCYALAGLALLQKGVGERVQVLMVRPEVVGADGEPEVFRFDYTASQQEELRLKLLATIEAMEQAQHASLDGVDPQHCAAFCTLHNTLCAGT